jgi:hypothetical protein
VIVVAVTLAAISAPNFREAWACTSRTEGEGLSVTVMRTLDYKGRQLRASAQWRANDLRKESLQIWGVTDHTGRGDPAVFRNIDVSSLNNQNNPAARTWRLLLHRRGKSVVPIARFSDAPVGTTVDWRKVDALVGPDASARLELVDASGRRLASTLLHRSWLDMVKRRLSQGLAASRAKASAFRKSCDEVTEWMRL